jgi:hypothetical protein
VLVLIEKTVSPLQTIECPFATTSSWMEERNRTGKIRVKPATDKMTCPSLSILIGSFVVPGDIVQKLWFAIVAKTDRLPRQYCLTLSPNR